MHTRSCESGFTLAEMLISLALMALLVTAAAMGIHAAQVSHAYNTEKADLVARVRGVLDRIARDIRRADSFSVPDGDDKVVTITMPDGSTRAYEWDGEDGGDLTLTVDGGTPATLTGFVHSFVVSDDNQPTCEVRLELVGDKAATEASITATPRKELF
ncbi:MAG TPA: prepilin-type N-terminal cleavage/methylation domain-containing protein [Phycisphaerae bacterium]|nr:prepilin-type N-terminal cleavage/methylation domain-containing protein [Phycisphaerae bacterium]